MVISGNTILCSECVNICLSSPYMKPGRYTLPTGTQNHFYLGDKFFLSYKSVIQKRISIKGFLMFTLIYSLVFNTSLHLDWLISTTNQTRMDPQVWRQSFVLVFTLPWEIAYLVYLFLFAHPIYPKRAKSNTFM